MRVAGTPANYICTWRMATINVFVFGIKLGQFIVITAMLRRVSHSTFQFKALMISAGCAPGSLDLGGKAPARRWRWIEDELGEYAAANNFPL